LSATQKPREDFFMIFGHTSEDPLKDSTMGNQTDGKTIVSQPRQGGP
jgi:hypothetical protein